MQTVQTRHRADPGKVLRRGVFDMKKNSFPFLEGPNNRNETSKDRVEKETKTEKKVG